MKLRLSLPGLRNSDKVSASSPDIGSSQLPASLPVIPFAGNCLRQMGSDPRMADTLAKFEACAFHFLENRHGLSAFVYRLVGDRMVAEDIVQEVWLRFARAIERGDEIQEAGKWCRGVARNLVLHHWRSQRNAKVLFDSEFLDQVELAFEENESLMTNQQPRMDALKQCVELLPGASRTLLVLRYDKGFSIEQIADTIKQKAVNVKKALSRLRQRLAECIEKRLNRGLTND